MHTYVHLHWVCRYLCLVLMWNDVCQTSAGFFLCGFPRRSQYQILVPRKSILAHPKWHQSTINIRPFELSCCLEPVVVEPPPSLCAIDAPGGKVQLLSILTSLFPGNCPKLKEGEGLGRMQTQRQPIKGTVPPQWRQTLPSKQQ